MKIAESLSFDQYIKKSSWSEWMDRDGIFVVRPASNSIYVGFANQRDAEEYANFLGEPWKVTRRGIYQNMTDDEIENDEVALSEIRRQRQFYNMKSPYSIDAPLEYDEETDTNKPLRIK